MVQAGSQQCACDCSCAETFAAEPLLLDTNVLSTLARIATFMAAAIGAGTPEDAFRSLLAALKCCGQRRLFLACEQLVNEIEGGKKAPFRYAVLDPSIFRELFQLSSGAQKPHWEAEHEGDTDRAILAAAVAIGEPVTIVTVDARFGDWVNRSARDGSIGEVTAMDGIELLGRLVACLALSEDSFSLAVECELAYLDTRVSDPTESFNEERATLRRASWQQLQNEVAWRLQRGDREGGRSWDL